MRATQLKEAPKFEFYKDPNVPDFACIEIKDGRFAEYKFHFVKIYVPEIQEDSNEDLMVNFNYELLDGAVDDKNRSDFNKTVASILMHILIEEADKTIVVK